MSEYIKARLAADRQDYTSALQHLANIVAFYNRDPEWLPAATFFEGTIYKNTGYRNSADNIAEELKRNYPEKYWGIRAEQLK